MANKTVTASIDERQLNSSYAAIKELQAQAEKRTQRAIEMLKQSARSSSDIAREQKRG